MHRCRQLSRQPSVAALRVQVAFSRSSRVQALERRYHSAQSSEHNSSSRRRFPFKTSLLTVLAIGGVGLTYLVYNDHHSPAAGIATQNVRFRKRIPESQLYKQGLTTDIDPLSILDPDELSSSTAHLVDLPLSQLIRAYIVFLASSSPFLVDIAPPTITKLEWLRENLPFGVGKPFWGLLVFGMRQTFFAQFVAGETAERSYPLLEKLHSKGCSAMLNWSAEADHAVVVNDKTGNDEGPKILKESFEELHRAIQAAVGFHDEYKLRPTMLAIKMTGLVQDPAVFERFTEGIESGQYGTLSLPASTSTLNKQDAVVPDKNQILSQSDIKTLLAVYNKLSSLLEIASSNGVRIAFDAEQSWYQPALSRIVTFLAERFNRTSNSEEGGREPIVYNTYQANLKNTEKVILADLQRAKEKGYSLGFKLVRGAYVTSENARASKKGVPSKVWPNKAATDACFDACSEIILQEVVDSLSPPSHSISSSYSFPSSWWSWLSPGRQKGVGPGPSIIYATHNATSIKRSLKQMREKGLISNNGRALDVDPRIRGRISYAQLLGMTDNLTTAMFQLFPHTPHKSGEPPLLPITALYVPYGQIDRVLPYLVRRAQENKAILQGSDGSGRGGAAEQRRAIGKEIRRRFLPFL